VTFEVMFGDTDLMFVGDGDFVNFTYVAEWHLPRNQFAPVDGGMSVTVSGFGFDPSRQYFSNFIFDDASGQSVISSPLASPLDFGTIVFSVPGIFQEEQNSTLTVVRAYLNPSDSSTPTVASTNEYSFQFVAYLTSASSEHAITRGDGSQLPGTSMTGPSTGGANLTIHGLGFRLQIDYVCTFS